MTTIRLWTPNGVVLIITVIGVSISLVAPLTGSAPARGDFSTIRTNELPVAPPPDDHSTAFRALSAVATSRTSTDPSGVRR